MKGGSKQDICISHSGAKGRTVGAKAWGGELWVGFSGDEIMSTEQLGMPAGRNQFRSPLFLVRDKTLMSQAGLYLEE